MSSRNTLGRSLPDRALTMAPIRPATQPGERGAAATAQKCSWCEKNVSLSSRPMARKCLGCQATDMWCISCKEPGCTALDCHAHETCWSQHLDPRWPAHIRAKHERSNPFPSLFVDAVTHSEKDESKLQFLHQRDRLARWFAVRSEKPGADPDIWLYDRFIRLCDPERTGNRATEHHYPTFVSFIGNTAVGKSTIVRAMLLMGLLSASGESLSEDAFSDRGLELIADVKAGRREMPVPRSGNIEHRADPTTFGVHLYRDQGSLHPRPTATRRISSLPLTAPPNSMTQPTPKFPLLLADCEGFSAGAAKTNAIRFGEMALEEEEEAEDIYGHDAAASMAGVVRLPITAECYGQGGKDGIDLFYARVLYAISDVIVFVTKEDTMIEKDLTKVLEWASAAVDKSYNQPSRKTLIIVRNMDRESVQHQEQEEASHSHRGGRDMDGEGGSSSFSNEDLERIYLHKSERPLWHNSRILAEFVTKHNSNVRPDLRIEDNQQLYDALFQRIRVCFVPDKGDSDTSPRRAAQVFHHLKLLRTQIERAAEDEQNLRSRGFAQYNVPVLSHILGQVFEHFRQFETPLNFYLATRRDNPTPRNVAQHVANFLRLVMDRETKAGRISGDGQVLRHREEQQQAGFEEMIVKALSLMLVIYVRRTYTHFPSPSDMFDHDLKEFLVEGLDIYLTEYEQCAYRFPSKNNNNGNAAGTALMTCSVRGRYDHKSHIYEAPADPNQSGPTRRPVLVAPGPFHGRRSWSSADQGAWIRKTRDRFVEMYHSVFTSPTTTSANLSGQNHRRTPSADTLDARLIRLRQATYRDSRGAFCDVPESGEKGLRSNKTCLSCLQSVPDHVVSCGHAYCPRCVQETARTSRSFECGFEITSCALCGLPPVGGNAHQVRLKPRCAGARILCLDGGGVRGIVELALLAAIRREVDLKIHVSELFDLILGTSTGGIVALAVAMSDKPLEDMSKFFKRASGRTFGKSRTGFTEWVRRAGMVLGQVDSRYPSTELQSELATFFDKNTVLFAPAISRHFQSTTRVAVTAARDNGENEWLIANYNRPLGDWTGFEREDDAAADMKVWEAALATSAAPYYLPAFRKSKPSSAGGGSADFVDGAVYANCPAKVAIEEKERVWPNEGTSLDVLLSLGTGYQGQRKRARIPRAMPFRFFNAILKMFEHQLDTNRGWEELERSSPPQSRPRLHRINPPVRSRKGEYVELDSHEEVAHLEDVVRSWTLSDDVADEDGSGGAAAAGGGGGRAQIRRLANILVASLFFFEPDPDADQLPCEGEALVGSIRCRLRHESEELGVLLDDKVLDFWHATATRAEVCQLPGSSAPGRRPSLPPNTNSGYGVGPLPRGRWKRVAVRDDTSNCVCDDDGNVVTNNNNGRVGTGCCPTVLPRDMVVTAGGTRRFRLCFRIPALQLTLPNGQQGAAYQVLAVRLKSSPEERIPISGFPALLEELGARSKNQWLQ